MRPLASQPASVAVDPSAKRYIVAKTHYVGEAKIKLEEGDEIEIHGKILLVGGERFRVDRIPVMIKNRLIVTPEEWEAIQKGGNEKFLPARVQLREVDPANKNILQKHMIEVDHNTFGGQMFESTGIPVPGAQQYRKTESHFDLNKWKAMHWKSKIALLNDITDMAVLKSIVGVEKGEILQHVKARINYVKGLPDASAS